MLHKDLKLSLGLLFLRWGLGIYLTMLAVDKIFWPGDAVRFFAEFYAISIGHSGIMLLGAVELVVGLLLALGMHKTIVYGLGLTSQLLALLASFGQLGRPFEPNNVFIACLPALFGFFTLFLLRDLDTLWSLGKKRNLFYTE
jgi:hypothetical protein